jgi:predicted dehydrogenase/threonine dehydrogenase-like Zn-dependent dehydrogenase
MKSILQNYRTGQLLVVESPTPQIRAGYALVRNAYSLISAGTEKTKVDTAQKSLLGKALSRPDMVKKVIAKAKTEGLWKTWQVVSDKLDVPTPLGYSSAGQIVEVNGDVDGLTPGDWVACAGNTANHAEIISVPKNLLAKIPDGVPSDFAAFATLGAIAMQGVRQAEVRLGEKVVVIGLGLIGLLTVQILRAAGCRIIGVDMDPAKLTLGRELGCDDALLPDNEALHQNVLLFTEGYGVDATIITAGTSSNQPIEFAGEITREKGKVVVVGAAKMDIPREPYYMKEIDIRISRSYGPGRYDRNYEDNGYDYPIGYVRFTEKRNMASFLELIQSKSIDLSKIITHRYSINEAPLAYEIISGKRKEPYLGILLEYGRPIEAIPRHLEIKPQPLNGNKIKIGFIGAGSYASKFLLPVLCKKPQLHPAAVCTASGVTAENIARKFGFSAAESDPDAVIKKSDAIVIATRHSDHAELVLSAVNQGKPVFVEKPLAITEEQLGKIAACLEKSPSNAPIMVGFNRRFAPATGLLKDHFEAVNGPKQILIRINAGSIPADNWIHDPMIGGGRLIGEGCHFVDLARFIAASPIAKVHAFAIPDPRKEAALWDNLSITLTFDDLSLATIVYTSSGDSALAKESIQVFGGGRAAIINDFRMIEMWAKGKSNSKRWSQQDKGQAVEIDAWVESLRTGKIPIPFEEIMNVHRACFAAIRSIQNGMVTEI